MPGGRASEPPPTEEGESLDFTNYVPPPNAPAPRPATGGAPAASEAGLSLDFASLAAAAAPQARQPEAPPPPPKSVLPSLPGLDAPATKSPPAKAAVKKPVDSNLSIEVEEGSPELPAAIEEAAVLFANGQTAEAYARLKKAVESEELGAWKLQVWLMLFDVLQQLGKKAEFEERSLEFVVKFERSAPTWVDPPPAVKPNPALKTGGAATVSLTGTLGAQSAAALEQLRKAAERQPRLRLDFARLQGIDPAGCKLLLDTLRAFKSGKKEVWLTGEATLLRLLRAAAKAGDAAVDANAWLLLLELYQMLGLHDEFEEAAVDYAVTYEVSPPSWEAPPPRPRFEPMEFSQPVATQSADDAFGLAGDIAGQTEQLFTGLAAYAAAANPVVLDFAAVRRIDFVNAGRLLNLLEKLKAEGRTLVIRGAGQMIIALFAVMGIPKIARIIPRK